ncbi:MAG: sigma-70 family RNA polymerase sigma factor [Bacteroidota bacterium]
MKRDEEIWVAIKENQEKALSALFMKYKSPLLNYGYTITQDRELLKDCIQELFVDLWRRKDKLGHVEKVKSYLFSSYRRLILNRLKVDQKWLRLTHPHANQLIESPEEVTIGTESEEILKRYVKRKINQLPRRQKEIIYLYFYSGLSHDAIAEMLGIKKQASWNLLSRALKKLKELGLGQELGKKA